tara:strand:- start:5065 stop:7701 length:2637 start_codon:yes stop_codon:yes gene_type:complete
MSLESKINLLLSQAKDDPRFKEISSTSLRMGTTSVSNEPLLEGFNIGVSPLISGTSANTPQFLDLRLELFVVLKVNIDNVKVAVSDVFKEIKISKEFIDALDIAEKVTKEVFKPFKESLTLHTEIKFAQKSSLKDIFNIQDFAEHLQTKSLLSNVETRQQVSKFLKEEFLRRQFRKEYPLYELANRLSKDHGVVGGFGRDFGFGGAQEDQYYWLDSTAWLGFSAINRHPKYGIINIGGSGSAEIPPLAPIFVSGISNPPFWYGNTGGWIYWWMPGYGLQSGANVFEDEAYTGVPNSSGYTNRRNNIYVWNLTNSNPYIPNFFTNPTDSNYWKKHPQEIINAQTLPASSEIINEPGELAQFVNEIVQILREIKEKPTDTITARTSTLVPKAKVTKETLNSLSASSFLLNRITESTNAKTVSDLNKIQLDKTLREIASIRASSILPSKGKIKVDQVSAKDEELKKLLRTITVKAELDDRSKLKVTKSKGEGETVGKSRSSLVINPAFFELSTDKFSSIIEKRFKVSKETDNKAKTLSSTSKIPGRGEREVFDIRDAALTPSKFYFDSDRFLSSITSSIKLDSPKVEQILSKAIAKLNPNKPAEETLNLLDSSPLVPKAKSNFDRVFVISDIDFDRRMAFESFIGWDAANEFITKDFEKIIHGKDKVNLINLVLSPKGKVLGTKIGVQNKDRDSGFFGDVFFLFNRAVTEETAKTLSFTSKLFGRTTQTKIKIRDMSLSPKAKILLERLLLEDTRHTFLVGKGLTEQKLFIKDETVTKDVVKNVKVSLLKSNNFVLVPKAKLNIDIFKASDNFNPWLFNKVRDFILEVKDEPKKGPNTGINNTLSSSMKGYAFIRDEDYVKGAYFLQPYVATIPPGRSRQF